MLHNFDPIVLLESLVFIYASFLAGNLFLRLIKIVPSSVINRAVYSILLGYGIFANAGLVLALLGFFNASFLRIFFAIIIAVAAPTILGHVRFLYSARRSIAEARQWLVGVFAENTLLKLIVVFWIFINFFIVFVPVTGTDAKIYHVPIIRGILVKERADFNSEIRYYHEIPVLTEVLYAVPIAIFSGGPEAIKLEVTADGKTAFVEKHPGGATGPFVFQLLQYGTLVMLLALLWDFLRRHIRHAFLLPLFMIMILAIFDLQREVLHGGYVDMMVFLFGAAGTLAVIRYCSADNGAKSRSDIYLSAIMLGLAMSMKYTALFFGVLNAAFLLIHYVFSRMQISDILKSAAKYSGIALVIAGYWYIRNFLWFGNPVYPMFSDEDFRSSVGWFAAERSFINFFLFPFIIFGLRFFEPDETSSRFVVLGYFIAMYALLGLVLLLRRRITRPELMLFLFVQTYMIFSFFFSHQIRFMLPALFMLPPLLALWLDDLYEWARIRLTSLNYRRVIAASMMGFYAFAVFMFFGNFHYFHIRFLYTLGIYTRDQYIGSIGSQ